MKHDVRATSLPLPLKIFFTGFFNSNLPSQYTYGTLGKAIATHTTAVEYYHKRTVYGSRNLLRVRCPYPVPSIQCAHQCPSAGCPCGCPGHIPVFSLVFVSMGNKLSRDKLRTPTRVQKHPQNGKGSMNKKLTFLLCRFPMFLVRVLLL